MVLLRFDYQGDGQTLTKEKNFMNKVMAGVLFTMVCGLSGCGVSQTGVAVRGVAVAGPGGKVVQSVSQASRENGFRQLFNTLDQNRDGALTRQDLASMPVGQPASGYWPNERERELERFFFKADGNRDGLLSFTEWRNGMVEAPVSDSRWLRVFRYMDVNFDDRVDFGECLNGPWGQPVGGYQPGEKEREARRHFALLDRNRDSLLSYEEFLALEQSKGQGQAPLSR